MQGTLVAIPNNNVLQSYVSDKVLLVGGWGYQKALNESDFRLNSLLLQVHGSYWPTRNHFDARNYAKLGPCSF